MQHYSLIWLALLCSIFRIQLSMKWSYIHLCLRLFCGSLMTVISTPKYCSIRQVVSDYQFSFYCVVLVRRVCVFVYRILIISTRDNGPFVCKETFIHILHTFGTLFSVIEWIDSFYPNERKNGSKFVVLINSELINKCVVFSKLVINQTALSLCDGRLSWLLLFLFLAMRRAAVPSNSNEMQ